MAVAVSSRSRVSVDGKFFRLGEKKFYVKGVAYGPFAPNAAGEPFASPEQTARDFAQIRELGANLIRVYHVPAKWFLDLARQHELQVLVDIPWNKQLCFLDSPQAQVPSRRGGAPRGVRLRAASGGVRLQRRQRNSAGHRALERRAAVADFIDELVLAKPGSSTRNASAPSPIIPPTEFLRPASVDFVCFNVYLHHEQPFENYLARLQMLAESKPLVLGEFGIDSLREGEAGQVRDAGVADRRRLSRRLGRRGSVQLHRRLVARRAADRRTGKWV